MIYDRYFSWIHTNHLIYNTCWEDPRIDRLALELDRDSRVLVITSAGCNALDYLLAGAGEVHAVDINPKQNALLELKIAAIRELSFPEFFLLFGRGYHPNFTLLYRASLRRHLSPVAQGFWDTHCDLFDVSQRIRGFYDRGTSGLVARALYWYIRRVAKVEEAFDELFDSPSLHDQRKLYFGEIKPKVWRGFIRWVSRSPYLLTLLGVPRAQRDLISRSHPQGVSGFIESSLDSVFGDLPLRDNYFWRVYLLGGYAEGCCPEYLTSTGFLRLKEGLWERLHIHTNSVSGFLRSSTQPITHAVLLDHMDWLYAHNRKELRAEWQGLVDRCQERSRIIWRSAAASVPELENTKVQIGRDERALGDMLRFDRKKAAELHSIDRVHTYQSFHIADLTPSIAA
jgi:S-adenosylmethionine-diacylglycerol 3-amino-3-carboxypropyl transferase